LASWLKDLLQDLFDAERLAGTSGWQADGRRFLQGEHLVQRVLVGDQAALT
jgi:hypothetical protein